MMTKTVSLVMICHNSGADTMEGSRKRLAGGWWDETAQHHMLAVVELWRARLHIFSRSRILRDSGMRRRLRKLRRMHEQKMFKLFQGACSHEKERHMFRWHAGRTQVLYEHSIEAIEFLNCG